MDTEDQSMMVIISKQLLGKSRPNLVKPFTRRMKASFRFIKLSLDLISTLLGVLILSAATNDLALLINTLDLQATPSTPDMTPLRPSGTQNQTGSGANQPDQEAESPLKSPLRRLKVTLPVNPPMVPVPLFQTVRLSKTRKTLVLSVNKLRHGLSSSPPFLRPKEKDLPRPTSPRPCPRGVQRG